MAQNVKPHLQYVNSGTWGIFFWKQNYYVVWNT